MIYVNFQIQDVRTVSQPLLRVARGRLRVQVTSEVLDVNHCGHSENQLLEIHLVRINPNQGHHPQDQGPNPKSSHDLDWLSFEKNCVQLRLRTQTSLTIPQFLGQRSLNHGAMNTNF